MIKRLVVFGVLTFALCCANLAAQSDTSRLSISIRAVIYGNTKKPDVQTVSLRLLPAPSWEVNVSFDLKRSPRRVWMISYQYGNLPVRIKTAVPASYHPDIPYELNFPFYYVQHPYHVTGIGLRVAKWKQWILFGIGNRFYSTSHARNGLKVNLDSGQVVDVFSSDTRFTRRYFCPQVSLGISGRIWSKMPSWNYEINMTFVPVSVVEGVYSFFPDDPSLKSSGTFSVSQNNFSVGLLYRRVKRINNP